MKKLIYILIVLSLVSCDDYLDIEPKGQLTPKTVDHLGDMFLSDYFVGSRAMYGAHWQVLKSDNMHMPFQFNATALSLYQFDPNVTKSNYIDDEFLSLYSTIYYANYALENVDTFEEGKNWTRERVKGIALYHRAFSHFLLANNYGKHYQKDSEDVSVPLITSTFLDQEISLAKTTDIYSNVINDLTLALPLLEDAKANHYTPSKLAVYAFLSRIYLYQGDYENAKKMAEEALRINSSLNDYNATPFYFNDYQYADIIHYKSGGPKFSYSLMRPSQAVIDLFDQANDMRFPYYFILSYDGNFQFAYNAPTNIGPSMGELYMNYIEACLRTDNRPLAEEKLNDFLPARYATAPLFSNLDDVQLLAFVLNERRREMSTTGTRVYDIKRLNAYHNAAITVVHEFEGETFICTPDSDQLVLPIPPNEADLLDIKVMVD